MKITRALYCLPVALMLLAGCGGGAGGAGSISAIPAEGIDLKLGGKAGDKEKTETVVQMNMEAPKGTPGVPADGKVNVKMTLVGDFEIQSIKDGKVTYKMKIADAKMEGNMPSNPALTGLKGKTGTLVYDERGKFLNSSGELGQSEQMFSTAEFPSKKIKKGDTWEQTTVSGGVPVTMINTLEGMEEVEGINCLLISMKLKDTSMMKMDTPAKMWVNPATGRPVKSDMTMTMVTPKATMRITLRKIS